MGANRRIPSNNARGLGVPPEVVDNREITYSRNDSTTAGETPESVFSFRSWILRSPGGNSPVERKWDSVLRKSGMLYASAQSQSWIVLPVMVVLYGILFYLEGLEVL